MVSDLGPIVTMFTKFSLGPAMGQRRGHTSCTTTPPLPLAEILHEAYLIWRYIKRLYQKNIYSKKDSYAQYI